MNRHLEPLSQYPVNGMMPKQETQAASFLKSNPAYDGRNTTIAIIDSGIDPGAKGMQITTDRKPKIIDIVDCTGTGDVSMKKIVKASVVKGSDGKERKVLQGLSGKSLIIDPCWTCPSGEYRVGVKPAKELFPESLIKQVELIHEEAIQTKNGHLLDKVYTLLKDFDEKNPEPSKEALLQRADLKTQIKILRKLEDSYASPLPLYDCVVFHDGMDWRAVIDVDESGDLRDQPCLTDYKKELQYHSFGKLYDLNFSVNIYEEGNILSIVTVFCSHGTHVAGIAAASIPEEPALNGVAPGTQLVSLRVLGPKITGLALTRAASYIAKHNIDLSNMSIGENGYCFPSGGHWTDLMAEDVISKSGCIVFASAGNEGPCLSSITLPGGIHESVITVGAYVHRPEMEAAHSLLVSPAEGVYTWSSRGPCKDGYSGVDIYAPGSAISSVPTYSLIGLKLQQGTSMASPNACGCAALLLSGLKAKKMKFTPFRIKTALVQSTKDVGDIFGVGFIQVEDAWKYLTKYQDRHDLDMQFKVRLAERETCRGIYLREQEETRYIQNLGVEVEPIFPSERNPENPQYNNAKRNCDIRAILKTTQPWIEAPNFIRLDSLGRVFDIKINPTELEEGQFHFGEIIGYDSTDNVANTTTSRGSLFRVPVSVAKPALTHNGSKEFVGIKYSPGHVWRHFVLVPEGATYCELTIRSKSHVNAGPALFKLQTLQIVPQHMIYSYDKEITLGNDIPADPISAVEVIKSCFAVRSGLNMELCLAQYWDTRGERTIDLSLEFHGIQITGNVTDINGVVHLNPDVTRLELIAPVRQEKDVSIRVLFDEVRKYIRPFKAEILPMHPERNTLPNTRLLYSLHLSYKVSLISNRSASVNFPTVNYQVFGHFLANISGILYDFNEKPVAYIDRYNNKLSDLAGEYTLIMHLITEKTAVLENLKATLCEIDSEANTDVEFNIYKTLADVYCSDPLLFKNTDLNRNDLTVFHVAVNSACLELLKYIAKPGDTLIGSLSFTREEITHDSRKIIYIVPPPPLDKEESTSTCSASISVENPNVTRQFNHWTKFCKLIYTYTTKKRLPNTCKVFTKIEAIWKASEGKSPAECLINQSLTEDQAKKIIKLSETITKAVASSRKNEQTRYKTHGFLMEATKNKLMALAATGQPLSDDFDTTFNTFEVLTTNKFFRDIVILLLKIQRERMADPPRYGNALNLVRKYLKKTSLTPDSSEDIEKIKKVRSQLYLDLGWDIWTKYDASNSILCQQSDGKVTS